MRDDADPLVFCMLAFFILVLAHWIGLCVEQRTTSVCVHDSMNRVYVRDMVRSLPRGVVACAQARVSSCPEKRAFLTETVRRRAVHYCLVRTRAGRTPHTLLIIRVS